VTAPKQCRREHDEKASRHVSEKRCTNQPPRGDKSCLLAQKNFGKQIAAAVEGTHYSVDHIYGIACQETAYFWLRLIDKLSAEDVCARCVLDASGDAPNTTRKAFPTDTKAFRNEYGNERTDPLIEEEANKTRVLRGYSRKNWVYKGYGLFQYDLQFIRVDPDFFFQKQWYCFDACLERVMRELRGTWARHGNIFEAIRAYNGAGHRAAVYAQNESRIRALPET